MTGVLLLDADNGISAVVSVNFGPLILGVLPPLPIAGDPGDPGGYSVCALRLSGFLKLFLSLDFFFLMLGFFDINGVSSDGST
jgi:hypothetical protein